MLSEVQSEYLEFSRPPYAVDPLDEKLVKQAASQRSGLPASAGSGLARRRASAAVGRITVAAGVEVRLADSLPMKLALFDGAAWA